jgi:hypothetical protein
MRFPGCSRGPDDATYGERTKVGMAIRRYVLRSIAFVTFGAIMALVAACSSSSGGGTAPPTGSGDDLSAEGGGSASECSKSGCDASGACNYVTVPIGPNDMTEAGVTPAQLGAKASGTHLAALTWGPNPSSEFTVTPTGTTTLTIGVTTMDSGWTIDESGGGLCGPAILSVPAMVHFATADGGFDEMWQVNLSASADGQSLSFTQRLSQLAGTFRVSDNQSGMWDSSGATVTVGFTDAGATGNVTYTTSFMVATGPNSGSGGGAIYTAAKWVPLASDAGGGTDADSADAASIDSSAEAGNDASVTADAL